MAQARILSIIYGGHTDKGVKTTNEDAFAAILPTEAQRYSKGAIVSIADGVSCSDNARMASQTSVSNFIQDYLSTPETWDVRTSASRVLSALNSWLFYQGQMTTARHNAYVTTFTSVIFKSTTAHILHCGDSRLYRLREGQLVQLTTDHCMVQGNGSYTLTRALGMDTELKVDYQQRSLREGDLLLFTTDGIHDYLKQHELHQLLEPLLAAEVTFLYEGRHGVLEKTAATVVDAALKAGSTDNLSCLLVRVQELPLESIDESHRNLTRLVIPPVLETGNKLDGYTVLRVLHSGSRSHLYLSSHPHYRRKFVLKVPSTNFTEDPQYLEGFLREQWVGRRISHASIMKIHDPVPDGKFLYHICEYIEGTTLRQWMYDKPMPELNEVRTLVKQLAAALRVFQRMGMLHRDLKPENIMLTPAGEIKLIDFGTVRVNGLQDITTLLAEEVPVGTADYLAPEYLQGESGEFRSDIFSLGVIVYEMFTGKLPYKFPSQTSIKPVNFKFWKYRSALEHRKELPLWVDCALAKACAPRPSQRYAALSEFLHDLEVPNQQLLSQHQQQPLLQKNPLLFWQLLSALLFFLLLLFVALLGSK